MKRIILGGAAAAALFTAGVPALATAATTTPASSVTKCKLALATQIPSNDTSVLAGTDSGQQVGKTSCAPQLGYGLTRDTFQTNDAGNLSGRIQSWFNGGTVYGTYFLKVVPNDGPPTSTSFASASYAGTVVIKGGHGTLRNAAGRGTLTCTTTDSAHFACVMSVKVSLPTATASSRR